MLAGWLVLAAMTGCADAEEAAEAPVAPEGPQALEGITAPAEEGAVHLVRMVQRGDRYSFEPDTITIPAGDVVRFVMTGSQPESVAFDKTAATPEISSFITSGSLDRGILLTNPGDSYDVSFRAAPAGNYPFHSVPHAIQGMRGLISVQAASE
jgi:plastocyanin